MKILLIESIPLLSQLFYSLFKKEGFQCIQAENLTKGLQNLKMIQFSLIFLDVRSSPQQLNELHEFIQQEKLEVPPVLLLHNSIDGQIPREGIQGHFLKPVQPHILMQKIKQMIHEHQTQKKTETPEKDNTNDNATQ